MDWRAIWPRGLFLLGGGGVHRGSKKHPVPAEHYSCTARVIVIAYHPRAYGEAPFAGTKTAKYIWGSRMNYPPPSPQLRAKGPCSPCSVTLPCSLSWTSPFSPSCSKLSPRNRVLTSRTWEEVMCIYLYRARPVRIFPLDSHSFSKRMPRSPREGGDTRWEKPGSLNCCQEQRLQPLLTHIWPLTWTSSKYLQCGASEVLGLFVTIISLF